MISYERYAQVFDKICITYFGLCDEYLILLAWMRESVKDVEVTIAGRNTEWISDDSLVMTEEEFRKSSNRWSVVCDVKVNPSRPHSLYQFTEGIEFVKKPARSAGNIFSISPFSEFPTRNMDKSQVDVYVAEARRRGYAPAVLDRSMPVKAQKEIINSSAAVVGVESPALFYAARNGIKTILVDNGIGSDLYKKCVG